MTSEASVLEHTHRWNLWTVNNGEVWSLARPHRTVGSIGTRLAILPKDECIAYLVARTICRIASHGFTIPTCVNSLGLQPNHPLVQLSVKELTTVNACIFEIS